MGRDVALRFMNVGHFLDHYLLLIFPTAVLAFHAEQGLDFAGGLALATPGFVTFCLATWPAGWLADRVGGRPLMLAFFGGCGASTIGTGLATGPTGIALGLAALGLFAAIYHPVATAMVVRLTDRPGQALGTNGVFGNLGVALPSAGTALLTAWLGWRMAFILPGIACLLMGLAYARLGGGEVRPAAAPASCEGPGLPTGAWRILTLVAVTSIVGGLVFNALMVALPGLYQERLGAQLGGLAGVGGLTSAVLVAASFTQLFTGRLIDRVGARPIVLWAYGLQVPLLLGMAAAAGWALVPVTLPLMLCLNGATPVNSWLLGRVVPPARRGNAYGLQFLLAFGITPAVVPLVAGLHARTGDMAALFVVLAAGQALTVAVAAWMLRGPMPMGLGRRPSAVPA